ncbi:MAG: response regulator [Pseudomonadales bacterium]
MMHLNKLNTIRGRILLSMGLPFVVFIFAISAASMHHLHYIPASTATVILLALAAIFPVSYLVGHTVVKPLEALNRLLDRVENGDNSYRTKASSGFFNTGQLGSRISRLTKRFDSAQGRAESATQQLQLTLIDLEQRNSELEKTRDELNQAMAARDDFLARMSHELRTPLTAILGFSDLLEQEGLDPQRIGYSTNIRLASNILLSVIDDILNYSRLNSTVVELDSTAFNSRQCLEEIVSMHARSAGDKDIQLLQDIDPALPKILVGDAVRFGQIIHNFISNSLKFTESGDVLIRIGGEVIDETHWRLRCSVSDTGIGMSEEFLQRAFQPFEQEDTSISRRAGGSGLGLVIAKQLIEMMNGSIIIESTGEGTKIQFDIRLGYEEDEQISSPKNDVSLLYFDDHAVSCHVSGKVFDHWTSRCKGFQDFNHLLSDVDGSTAMVILCVSTKTPFVAQQANLDRLCRIFTGPVLILGTQVKIPALVFDQTRVFYQHKVIRSKDLFGLFDRILHLNQTPTIPSSDAIGSSLKGYWILLAEDNKLNRAWFRRVIEKQGARVTFAESGPEMLAIADERLFDLVLLDIHMPEMDGFEASKRLRQMDGYQDTPIIAVTADTSDRIIGEMTESGINRLLYKPLPGDSLILSIKTILSSRNNSETKTQSAMSLDKDILGEIKDEFLHKLALIRTLLVRGDGQYDVLEESHQMKGAAGLWGLNHIHSLLLQLERSIEQENSDVTYRLLDDLALSVKNLTV